MRVRIKLNGSDVGAMLVIQEAGLPEFIHAAKLKLLGAKAVDCIQQVLWEKLAQICNASAWSVSTLAGNSELTFVHGMALPVLLLVTIALATFFVSSGDDVAMRST